MLVRLISNSWPQVICLPRPPKVLGRQAWATTSGQYLEFSKYTLIQWFPVGVILLPFPITPLSSGYSETLKTFFFLLPPPILHLQVVPSVCCCLLCVHMFSSFSSHLWVRTCRVWFSVPVLLCWEWWFSASSMSLLRTRTHPFLWLHSIPWCICATFSLSSLSWMGIWVGSKSLLLWTVLQSACVHVSLENNF